MTRDYPCCFCGKKPDYVLSDVNMFLCNTCSEVYKYGQKRVNEINGHGFRVSDYPVPIENIDFCDVCDGPLQKYGTECTCVSGHKFCKEHLVNTDDPHFQEKEEDMMDVPMYYCPICHHP
jgi:hypothetical protein